MQTLSWNQQGKLSGDDHAFCALGYFLGLAPQAATLPTSDEPDLAWQLFADGTFLEDEMPTYTVRDLIGNERVR